MAGIYSESASAPEKASEAKATPGERSDDDILKDAHAFIKLVEDAEQDNRALALADLEFAAGAQWPEEVKAERQSDGRPCLVINRIPQFIQQVTNDQRQNRPSIKVHPVDDNADVETAKVIQGLIRHVEYNSNADAAYDTAFDFAARMGWGFLRVRTDYCDPLSFEQEIYISRIRNPFSVFFDPYAQEPDGSDAKKAAITEDFSKDEYIARFPDSKLAEKSADWEVLGNNKPDWLPSGSARVAEYFYTDVEEVDLVQLSDGSTLKKSDLPAHLGQLALLSPDGIPAVTVVRERRSQVPVIKHCKLNAIEILEKTTWPSKYIPIVPVYGSDQFINGKRILKGLVRDAMDSQRMYNYWASAETEAIALAPRAPFIVAEGQIEGYEEQWRTANRKNHSVLTYKPTDVKGQPVSPPQRNAFEPAVQAISQARMLASDDMKATTGLYDAARGAQSNETSGIAIQRRSMQAQTSNFHYVDNLTRSLKHVGKICIDLFPKIYDTARTGRIIGEDGEQKVVKLNQPTDEIGADGEPLIYAMDVGKYDVTVDVGPSYASKRQEAVASMLELAKANPAITQIAGDLLVKNMDWPGASEIAERLRKTLPPNLQDDDKKKQPIPPQIQAQLQQQGQMLEQLTEQLNQAQDQIQHKRVELESKERIEMAKLETQTRIELAKLDAKDSIVLLQAQIQELDARQRQLGSQQPIPDVTADNGGPQQFQLQEPMEGAYPGAEFGDGGLDPHGGEMPQQSPEEQL